MEKGELLIIDLSKRPKLNDLIVVDDRIIKLKFISAYNGVEIRGVVIALIKELVQPLVNRPSLIMKVRSIF